VGHTEIRVGCRSYWAASFLSQGHRLGLQVEKRSLAEWKLWKFKYPWINSIIEQEQYQVRFKFKNLGSKMFPGGTAAMRVMWPTAGRRRKVPLTRLRCLPSSLHHPANSICGGEGTSSPVNEPPCPSPYAHRNRLLPVLSDLGHISLRDWLRRRLRFQPLSRSMLPWA
jgi:hypothetical protein